MTNRETYSNGFQRRAVEALLEENLAVEADPNSGIKVYGTEHDDVSALWKEVAPYDIAYVSGVDSENFAFKATLWADWEDVDFDNEPYQEDSND